MAVDHVQDTSIGIGLKQWHPSNIRVYLLAEKGRRVVGKRWIFAFKRWVATIKIRRKHTQSVYTQYYKVWQFIVLFALVAVSYIPFYCFPRKGFKWLLTKTLSLVNAPSTANERLM